MKRKLRREGKTIFLVISLGDRNLKLITNGEDEKCVRCGKTIRKGTGFYAYPEGPVCTDCVSEKEIKKWKQ